MNILLAFLKPCNKGSPLQKNINYEFYLDVKNNKETYDKAIVGCVGFLFTSRAKWFRGFIGSTEDVVCVDRDRIGESYRAVEKAREQVRGLQLHHCHYENLRIPQNSVIYCDPPYKGTESYKDKFNHDKFYDWCREKRKEGHTVFVSEYWMPDDFTCVWQKEVNSSLTKDTGSKKAVEKLFTLS